MQHVEAYIAFNTHTLSQGLANIAGVELQRPHDPGRISGIVSFKMPAADVTTIHRALKNRQLTCAVRGDSLRLSPHFYQAGDPVQEMLDIIENTVGIL